MKRGAPIRTVFVRSIEEYSSTYLYIHRLDSNTRLNDSFPYNQIVYLFSLKLNENIQLKAKQKITHRAKSNRIVSIVFNLTLRIFSF